MRTLCQFAVALIFVVTPARSQGPEELWVQRYDGPTHQWDEAVKVALDSAGNVIVAGYSSEAEGYYFARYTAKYAAADGALLWEKRHRAPGGRSDWANDLALDSAGNVAITGATDYGDVYSDKDYYTAKYAAADGALLWKHRYNGPAEYDDEGYGVAVDRTGNVIVTGFSWENNDVYSAYTAKYAAVDGALLWERRGTAFSLPSMIVVDGAGNVIIIGSTADPYGDFTAKYAAADGALLWEHRGGRGSARSTAVDSVGNVIVTGGSESDLYTASYAPADGALLWERRCHEPDGSVSYGTGAATDSAGNVIVMGVAESGFYTAKYAVADGALLWKKRRHKFAPTGVALDSTGNVVIVGYSANGVTRFYYTAKYAALDGALLWERSYEPSPNGAYTEPSSVAVGPGCVVMTGRADGLIDPNDPDFVTVKYLDGPTSQTVGAQVLSANKARLSGAVNPNGFATNAAFEYGTDPTLASAVTTVASAIGSGSAAVAVGATLFSLRPRTTYYYRAIGIGSGVTLRGAILTFTTPPATSPPPPTGRPTTPRPSMRR